MGNIQIFLEKVFISDVIDAYGAPNHIINPQGYSPSISLIYPAEGLIFWVLESDGNLVHSVYIVTREVIERAYINDLLNEVFTSCSEPTQLCAVATATPMPACTDPDDLCSTPTD